MKKMLSVLFIAFLLSGCASLPKREFIDGIFTSNKPDIKLKINDDFTYIGKYNLTFQNYGEDFEKSESHVFIYASQGTVKRILTIRFKDLVEEDFQYMANDPFGKVPEKNRFETGKIDLSGVKHDYCLGFFPVSKDLIQDFSRKEGYLLPDCVLMDQFVRIVSKGNNNKIEIIYYEDSAESLNKCDVWEAGNLGKPQKLYLEGFAKRAVESFTILKAK